jgi:hypothetical protein
MLSLPLRLSVSVLTAPLLLAGLAFCRCGPLSDFGLDLGGLCRPLRTLNAERQRRERLTAGCEDIIRQVESKVDISEEVALGRRTLVEAAARLRELLDEAPPEYWDQFRETEQGATDAERLCRHVIAWVRTSAPLEQAGTEAECERLERELQDLLRHGALSDLQAPTAAERT